MKKLFKTFCVTLTLCLSYMPAPVQANLDARLDQLHSEMKAKFLSDSSIQDQTASELAFEFLPKTLFRKAMKSFCALRQSANWGEVKNPNIYTFVDLTPESKYRRMFVFDLQRKKVIHNIWVSHGNGSVMSLDLRNQGKVISQVTHYDTAQFFSNLPNSNQSSVGMAVADANTHVSPNWGPHALHLTGVDGTLNSNLRNRDVKVHALPFDSKEVFNFGYARTSNGCLALPKSGNYQRRSNVQIEKEIANAIKGSPILTYHDRMEPSENERGFVEQKQHYGVLYSKIQKELLNQGITNTYTQNNVLKQLRSQVLTPILNTHNYFKNRSRYWNQEPNEALCAQALGI